MNKIGEFSQPAFIRTVLVCSGREQYSTMNSLSPCGASGEWNQTVDKMLNSLLIVANADGCWPINQTAG